METSASQSRDADPVRRDPRAATGRRNATVLVGFTGVTSLADGVTRMVLLFLEARRTDSPSQVTAVWLLVALYIGCACRTLRPAAAVGVDGLAHRLLSAAAESPVADTSGLGSGVSLPQLFSAAALIGVAGVLASTSASALVPAAVPATARKQGSTWMLGGPRRWDSSSPDRSSADCWRSLGPHTTTPVLVW
ncbi:hypothetical protein ACFWP5_04210 [Streptomyces sp. NPDC058469]|uniref:hypothetical protein n=1 Tax=Streptomyces sp. NPDC058469 TaxID=3346514 RepID=UPI0036607A7B